MTNLDEHEDDPNSSEDPEALDSDPVQRAVAERLNAIAQSQEDASALVDIFATYLTRRITATTFSELTDALELLAGRDFLRVFAFLAHESVDSLADSIEELGFSNAASTLAWRILKRYRREIATAWDVHPPALPDDWQGAFTSVYEDVESGIRRVVFVIRKNNGELVEITARPGSILGLARQLIDSATVALTDAPEDNKVQTDLLEEAVAHLLAATGKGNAEPSATAEIE